jgi:hypothetical protein
MKQIYPPQEMKIQHFPLKNLIVFLFFFLLLVAGVRGQCICDPAPDPVALTVPANYNGTTCMTQAAVDQEYIDWLAEAGFTGGCGASISNDAPISAPSFCGGSVTVIWTVASDCQGDVTESRTFTIPTAPAVNLTVPANFPGTTCMTQEDIDAAYASFVGGASFTGGCGGVLSNNAPAVAPSFCGGSVTVEWTVTSACEVPVVKSATFTIPAAPAVNLTVPANFPGTACMTQEDIDAAYASFVGGASFTGGCGGVLSNNAPAVAPSFCGGSVTVEWTVTSACEVPVVKSATFTIPAAPAVNLNVPANYTGTTCMTQDAVNTAFTNWLAEASMTNAGCSGVLTRVPETPTAPAFCGGSVTVEWTVTSACEVPVVKSATFTIPAAPAVNLNVPANYTGTTCMTKADIDAAYTAFVNGASFNGGCGGSISNNAPASAPSFCGGSVTVEWTVTSDCEVLVVKSATFTIPAAPAVNLNVPANYTGTACMTQADVDVAYLAWLAEASFTGGCSASISNNAPANAPSFCGGSVTVEWTVTSGCGAAVMRSASFTIPAAPQIILTAPQNFSLSVPQGCLSQAEINSSFNTWLNGVSHNGGCNPVVVTPNTTTAPGNCGSVMVTWTATDGCSVVTASSTFTVENLNPTLVSLSAPEDQTVSYQSDVEAAFSIWLSGFEYSGGCGNVTHATNPVNPQVPNLPCGGGSTTVVYTVTTDCEVISETRTFSVDYTSMLYDNIVTEENPNAPLVDYYDDRNTAYISNGVSGSEGDLVHWLDASWTRCLQDGVNIGYPNNNSSTPKPVANNKSHLYIQISWGDYIYVEKVSYQNNITIVVCGYLEIGEFSVEEDDEDQGAFLNNVNIVICEGGFLKAKVLELKNTVTIYNFGTLQAGLITGQGSASTQCIQGTGNFQDLDGNTIIYNDPEDGQWYVNDDYITLVDPDPNNPLGWTFGEDCESRGVLPIELLSFTSEVKPDRINLLWTTGSEINNDYFSIERGRDVSGWEVLGFVPGAGNSSVPLSYSFSDMQPLDGLAYYRLKQTDFDGQFKYYGPIAAHYDLGLEGLDFKVLKQYANWIIAVPQDGIYQVEVYTLTGRRLISEKTENTLTIPAPEGGVVIRVTDGFARSASKVVM